jgi:hypothetical protein
MGMPKSWLSQYRKDRLFADWQAGVPCDHLAVDVNAAKQEAWEYQISFNAVSELSCQHIK